METHPETALLSTPTVIEDPVNSKGMNNSGPDLAPASSCPVLCFCSLDSFLSSRFSFCSGKFTKGFSAQSSELQARGFVQERNKGGCSPEGRAGRQASLEGRDLLLFHLSQGHTSLCEP